MASSKKYAYYLRGNQVAIIEEDSGLGTGTCSLSDYKNKVACENAGGTWTAASTSGSDTGGYKSPQTSITDGLEIEYAYSPRYTIREGSSAGLELKLISSGWFVDSSSYLNFLTTTEAEDSTIISAGAAPWNAISVNDYFLVGSNPRWNGIHKAKSFSADGFIQTYTKIARSYDTGLLTTLSEGNIKISADGGGKDGRIWGTDASDVWVNRLLSVGDFVWIYSGNAGDEGLYKVTVINETDEGDESDQNAELGYKYSLSPEDDIDGFQATAETLTTDSNGVLVIKVKHEPCYITAGVDVLNDESDTIDLPEYLTKALVYYVKSQMAEEMRNLEEYVYYRKQFRALIERYQNSRIWGSRKVMAGSHAIR